MSVCLYVLYVWMDGWIDVCMYVCLSVCMYVCVCLYVCMYCGRDGPWPLSCFHPRAQVAGGGRDDPASSYAYAKLTSHLSQKAYTVHCTTQQVKYKRQLRWTYLYGLATSSYTRPSAGFSHVQSQLFKCGPPRSVAIRRHHREAD